MLLWGDKNYIEKNKTNCLKLLLIHSLITYANNFLFNLVFKYIFEVESSHIYTLCLPSNRLARSDTSSLKIKGSMFLPNWYNTNQSPIWHFLVMVSTSS